MTLPFVWYVLLAAMLVVYVVLDGFDLGVGILHLWVARSNKERNVVLESVGPIWDGNEVWLIAAGGTMVMAFPTLYAVSFSGFYLPLMILLWLLVFRALGIELKHQLHHPLWNQLWDVAFSASSLLLTVFLGAALGNIIRGVSIDATGNFFAPLWTNFLVGEKVGILDWYTILVALNATAAVTLHGALWLCFRVIGEIHTRARVAARHTWIGLVTLTGLSTVATLSVQPQLARNLSRYPTSFVFPAVALIALLLVPLYLRREKYRAALFASCGFIAGMLSCAALAIFPYVLPARDAAFGLSLDSAAAPTYGLRVALYWWIPGILLATSYFVYNYCKLPKNLSVDELT